MQAALALFVGLGGVEVVPLVGQVVFFEIGFQLRIVPMEKRAHLQSAEIGIGGHDVEPGPVRILHLAQRGDPDRGGQFAHAALERFQLHQRAKLLEPLFITQAGQRPVDRLIMGGADLWKIGLDIQPQPLAQQLRVPVGGGPVQPVIHPEHGNIRLHLRG